MMNSIKSLCLQNKVLNNFKDAYQLPNSSKVYIEDKWDIEAVPVEVPMPASNYEEQNFSELTKLDWYLANNPNDLPCIIETSEESYITPRPSNYVIRFDPDDMIATYRRSTTYIDPNINETDIDESEIPQEMKPNDTQVRVPESNTRNNYNSVGISKSAPEIKKVHRRTKAMMKMQLSDFRFSMGK
jgi:hypothetical protein